MSALTTPGVYIREIPSGNRAIAGVATSITAFVGAAPRGLLNTPTLCTSWSDYERRFGGLWAYSPMSQAVRHFFLNGGGQALIVRVVDDLQLVLQVTEAALTAAGGTFDHLEASVTGSAAGSYTLALRLVDGSGTTLDDGSDPLTGDATISIDGSTESAQIEAIQNPNTIQLVEVVGAHPARSLPDGTHTSAAAPDGSEQAVVGTGAQTAWSTLHTGQILEAASPGAWANGITVDVDHTDAAGEAFHLTLTEVDDVGNPVTQEVYYSVSLDPTAARWLGRILEIQSQLCRLTTLAGAATTRPPASPDPSPLAGGTTGAEPGPAELTGSSTARTGMHALLEADLFNLLCLPLAEWSQDDAEAGSMWDAAIKLCEDERAFLLIDPPSEWSSAANATDPSLGAASFGWRSNNAALYFPRIKAANPLQESRLAEFPPCGVVAGTIARTDGQRGIWKAPAGTDATVRAVRDLPVKLVDAEHGILNDYGVNALRTFPVYGTVVWGARTLNGANVLASEWKYVPVRRLALHLEESLFRGTQWAVFEPNDEPLWSQLRLSIGSFLHGLFRQGAFAGATPREAYFVKCDADTTTQTDIDLGVVNVIIGFSPLHPAEFVIIKLQQLVAQTS